MDISDKLAMTASLLLVAAVVTGFAGGMTLDFRGKGFIARSLLALSAVFAVFALGLGVAAVWIAQ